MTLSCPVLPVSRLLLSAGYCQCLSLGVHGCHRDMHTDTASGTGIASRRAAFVFASGTRRSAWRAHT